MSWLYSIIIAGLMFSNESALPVHTNYSQNDTNIIQVVKLDETERFEQTYPLDLDGKVSVSNVNGSITIETWDNPQVKLEAVKTADSRERLSEVEIRIDAKQNYFQLETDYGNSRRNGRNWNGKLQVEYKLTVPRNAVLDEIETVNGSIYISNAANTTKASTVNGQIKATNLRGTANLSTVNGTVEADFDQLQTGSRISLDTVNGTANLIIPSDANATIKADTVNGNINNEFGLPVRKGKYVGKDLYGRIGSGDVQIKLNSVNGGLSVRRKNDGKNLNPATNLLPQKSSEDFDNDGDVSVNTTRMNKDVAKAVKEAQKEIAKIQPELDKATAEAMKQSAEAVKQATEMINSKEMREKLKEAAIQQREVLAQMSNANWLIGSPVIEKKSNSYTVKGTPKVTIVANNCAVSVRGWDKSEVQYTVTKIGRNRNQTPMDIQTNQSGADVNIKVINDDETPRILGVNNIRLEVFVPKKSNLKITTDGEIRLEGVSGEIELNGADGAINVRDSAGNMRLTAADGRIRVLGFTGEIYAQSADGDVNLEGNFQKLTARTEDGSIILTLPDDTGVNLISNQEITNEGLNLTKEKENNWRIGKGGANFQLQTTDGKIFIRNIAKIKAYQ
ncbi:hypothetical protein BH20ACI1_BH20ACI1_05600 [soil metagenome]